MRYTLAVTTGGTTTTNETDYLTAAITRYAKACIRYARSSAEITLTDNHPPEHPDQPRLMATATFHDGSNR